MPNLSVRRKITGDFSCSTFINAFLFLSRFYVFNVFFISWETFCIYDIKCPLLLPFIFTFSVLRSELEFILKFDEQIRYSLVVGD